MPGDDAGRRRRALELLEEALERPTSERRALIERRSGRDDELRDEVLHLLELAEDDDDLEPLVDRAAPETDERTVGPYRLKARVGAGGMGEVWRAERADGAFHREVAVKLLSADVGGDDRAATIRDALDAAARDLERRDWTGRARLEARLRLGVGRAYLQLGAFAVARPHLARAVELVRADPSDRGLWAAVMHAYASPNGARASTRWRPRWARRAAHPTSRTGRAGRTRWTGRRGGDGTVSSRVAPLRRTRRCGKGRLGVAADGWRETTVRLRALGK